MNRPLSIKLRKIFIPYLLLSLGLLVGYMLLHWLFDSFDVTLRNSGVYFIDYWVVLLAPVIVAVAYMSKRLRILKTGPGYIFFIAIMYLLLQLPLDYAGEFISKAPYKLHHVTNVEDINPKKVKRYYKIDHFKLLTTYAPTTMGRTVDDEYVNYYMYVPVPMVDTFKRHRFYKPKIFYAQEYLLTLPRKGLPLFYYDYRKRQFVDSAQKDFDKFAPNKDCYYERLDASPELSIYKGLIKVTYNVKGRPYVLRPVYEPFAQRYIDPLLQMLWRLGAGLLGFFLLMLIPKIDVYGYKRVTKDYYLDYEEDEEIDVVKSRGLSQFFVPSKEGLIMTPILINLNILYFVLLVLAGYSAWGLSINELDAFGGFRYQTVVEQGEYWRLILGTFLHADVVHLFGNMLFLAAGGTLLERVVGKWTFLMVYLLCAIVASVGSMLYYENLVAVGASGAVLGIYGLMLPLLLMNVLPRSYKVVNIFIILFVLVAMVIMNRGVQVDVAAHVTGYLFGASIGSVIAIVIKERRQTVTLSRNNYYEVEEQQAVASAGAFLYQDELDNDESLTEQ